jgi:hypothetical protein
VLKAIHKGNVVSIVVLFVLGVFAVWGYGKSATTTNYEWLVGPDYTLPVIWEIGISILAVFIQARLFAVLVNDLRIIQERTFLPVWLFLLVQFVTGSFIGLLDLQLFIIVFLFFLRLVFRGDVDNKNKRLSFDVGILLGLGAVVYPPSLFYLILWWIVVYTIHYFDIQRAFQIALSTCIAILFTACITFLLNQSSWNPPVLGLRSIDTLLITAPSSAFFFVLFLMTIMGSIHTGFLSRYKTQFSKMVLRIMHYTMIFGALVFFFAVNRSMEDLYLSFLVPAAFITSVWLLSLKPKWFAEVMIWVLIVFGIVSLLPFMVI